MSLPEALHPLPIETWRNRGGCAWGPRSLEQPFGISTTQIPGGSQIENSYSAKKLQELNPGQTPLNLLGVCVCTCVYIC